MDEKRLWRLALLHLTGDNMGSARIAVEQVWPNKEFHGQRNTLGQLVPKSVPAIFGRTGRVLHGLSYVDAKSPCPLSALIGQRSNRAPQNVNVTTVTP